MLKITHVIVHLDQLNILLNDCSIRFWVQVHWVVENFSGGGDPLQSSVFE